MLRDAAGKFGRARPAVTTLGRTSVDCGDGQEISDAVTAKEKARQAAIDFGLGWDRFLGAGACLMRL